MRTAEFPSCLLAGFLSDSAAGLRAPFPVSFVRLVRARESERTRSVEDDFLAGLATLALV